MEKRWLGKHNYLSSLVRQAARQEPLDIYFLGDSLTEFWPYDGAAVWRSEFGKQRVLNCGMSGDATQNILYRITHGEFEGLAPKVIVLLAGINNLGSSPAVKPEDVAAGVKQIVATLRAKSPASRILVLSIFPSSDHTDPIRQRILETNRRIAEAADARTVFYLDLYNAFLDARGEIPSDVSPDGTHLYAKGYRIWADAMCPTLRKLLEEAPEKPDHDASAPAGLTPRPD